MLLVVVGCRWLYGGCELVVDVYCWVLGFGGWFRFIVVVVGFLSGVVWLLLLFKCFESLIHSI